MTLTTTNRARIGVVLAAAATWWVTLDAPFAEDDYLFLEAVATADAGDLAGYALGEGVMDHHHRPLSDPYFFALVEHGLGGSPMAAHVLLIAVHVLSAWLLIDIARRLTGSVAVGGVAAVLYVTRDFAFPSMSWGSGFSDIGSTCLALAACALLLRQWDTGRARDRWLAVLAAAAAILTKETAVVLVGVAAWLAICAEARGTSRWGRVRSLWPLVVVALPIAFWQFAAARFSEAVGQALYELEVGSHALVVWPAYLSWCVIAIKEWFETPAVRWIASGLSVALLLVAAFRFRHTRGQRIPMGMFTLGWFTIAILPALLAPNRVLTNYVTLAAAGPCLWIASAVVSGWSARGVRRGVSAIVAFLLIAGGAASVAAKERGAIRSGGWIDVIKRDRLEHALGTILSWEAFTPPANARVVVFGGLSLDVRVFGDPRRTGFGPQQVLASALRYRLSRYDLDVLSLPPVAASPPWVFEQLAAWSRESNAPLVVLDVTGPIRDRTSDVTRALASGARSESLRRVLLGS